MSAKYFFVVSFISFIGLVAAQDGSLRVPLNMATCNEAEISWSMDSPPFTLELLSYTNLDQPPIRTFNNITDHEYEWIVDVPESEYVIQLTNSHNQTISTQVDIIKNPMSTPTCSLSTSSPASPASSNDANSTDTDDDDDNDDNETDDDNDQGGALVNSARGSFIVLAVSGICALYKFQA